MKANSGNPLNSTDFGGDITASYQDVVSDGAGDTPAVFEGIAGEPAGVEGNSDPGSLNPEAMRAAGARRRTVVSSPVGAGGVVRAPGTELCATVTPEIYSDRDVLSLELTRAAGRFSRIAGRSVASGFSLVAWRVLAELEASGPSRVSELAQRERVAQPSMSGIVSRLEAEGWATRATDPTDRRASLVTLTHAGATALATYRARAAERVRPHLEDLSEFDRATLARAAELMQYLIENISDPRAERPHQRPSVGATEGGE